MLPLRIVQHSNRLLSCLVTKHPNACVSYSLSCAKSAKMNQRYRLLPQNLLVLHNPDHKISLSTFSQNTTSYYDETIGLVIEDMLSQSEAPDKDDIARWGKDLERVKFWPLHILRNLTKVPPSERKTRLSLSLLEYVQKSKEVPTIAFEIHQIITLVCLGEEKYVAEGLRLMDSVEKKYKMLDSTSLKLLSKALLGTKHWKEAFRLQSLRKFQTSSEWLVTAVNNGDMASAALAADNLPQASHSSNSMDTIFASSDPLTCLNIFMNSLQKRHLPIFREECARSLGNWFARQPSYAAKKTSIRLSGVCQCCGEELPSSEIDNQKFEALRKSFIDKALIDKDLLESCEPYELQNFYDFLANKKRPFDVVIDGLNLFHALGKDRKKMVTVLSTFARRNMSILLVVRNHLLQELEKSMTKIEEMASVFALKNSSKDDQFVLYAALDSGKDTYVLAKDYYDQYIHLMGEDLGECLKRWLHIRRIFVLMLGMEKRLKIQWPPLFGLHVHCDENGYHLPYLRSDEFGLYNIQFNWWCIRKQQ